MSKAHVRQIIRHRKEIVVFSRNESWEHGDAGPRACGGEERYVLLFSNPIAADARPTRPSLR